MVFWQKHSDHISNELYPYCRQNALYLKNINLTFIEHSLCGKHNVSSLWVLFFKKINYSVAMATDSQQNSF